MPKSTVPKKQLFREFSMQDKKYLRRNYLKNLKKVKHLVNKEYDVSFSMIEFLLWGYCTFRHIKKLSHERYGVFTGNSKVSCRNGPSC